MKQRTKKRWTNAEHEAAVEATVKASLWWREDEMARERGRTAELLAAILGPLIRAEGRPGPNERMFVVAAMLPKSAVVAAMNGVPDGLDIISTVIATAICRGLRVDNLAETARVGGPSPQGGSEQTVYHLGNEDRDSER